MLNNSTETGGMLGILDINDVIKIPTFQTYTGKQTWVLILILPDLDTYLDTAVLSRLPYQKWVVLLHKNIQKNVLHFPYKQYTQM